MSPSPMSDREKQEFWMSIVRLLLERNPQLDIEQACTEADIAVTRLDGKKKA